MPGALAVFDADGTLWRDDVGEAFLRHLVSLGWVRLPDGSDPYEAYERAVDRDKACGDAFTGDLPMLEKADIAVVVAPAGGSPFSIEARKRGWPVLSQDG